MEPKAKDGPETGSERTGQNGSSGGTGTSACTYELVQRGYICPSDLWDVKGDVVYETEGCSPNWVLELVCPDDPNEYNSSDNPCENPDSGEVILVLDAYTCNCDCPEQPIDVEEDLDSNMEPKWGQLANKQEILEEIESLTNLSSQSFETQIQTLITHFEKNLLYGRDNSGNLITLSVRDGSFDVNRYIYSNTHGWLDFHHVFKLFDEARKNGQFIARMSGEMGEIIQSLKKNNHSAFSYEDLPSNNFGVGLYSKYGEDLSTGSVSWLEVIDEALTDMDVVEPEFAPNFDYIPHIIHGEYPKNFTYIPLLGTRLANIHKSIFCSLPIDLQQKIIEAHETHRR